MIELLLLFVMQADGETGSYNLEEPICLGRGDVDENCIRGSEFIIHGYTITTNSILVTDILLDWGSKDDGPLVAVAFNKTINDQITLKIPKSMSRTTNLDFGHFALFALQKDGSSLEVKETESECFYILEIPVNNSNYVEIIGASVSPGRIGTVVIENNEKCDELSNDQTLSLKQQIADNFDLHDMKCSSQKHVLVLRPNDKLACVTFETAEKLNWTKIN